MINLIGRNTYEVKFSYIYNDLENHYNKNYIDNLLVNLPYNSSIGNGNKPIYFKDGQPVVECAEILGIDIDACRLSSNFTTQFRTDMKFDTYDFGVKILRTDDDIDYAPKYSSGLCWSFSDTHSYLNINYESPEFIIGAGSSNKLNWIRIINIDSLLDLINRVDVLESKIE